MSAATPPTSHWRIALALGAAGALATACVIPYVLALQPGLLAQLRALPVPLAFLGAAQLAQAFVVLGALSWIGLRLGQRIALDAPLLRAWLHRQPLEVPRRTLALACASGALAGAAIIGLDLIFRPMLPPALQPLPADIAAWKGLLASFYGGIAEEIQTRLFLVTLIAWILCRIRGGTLSPVIAWTAIIVAALLFGAAHLPMAFQIWGVNGINIARTVVLNAVAGIVFGYLFWRHGFEHAMAAHFSADIVLHVVAPT